MFVAHRCAVYFNVVDDLQSRLAQQLYSEKSQPATPPPKRGVSLMWGYCPSRDKRP